MKNESQMINDDFIDGIAPHWYVTEQGQGRVIAQDSKLYLEHPTHDKSSYSNAQISDYDRHLDFRLRPPLRMTVRAHATTSTLQGTAGFGFWNHPFAPNSSRVDLPQAVWFFFASKESNMALAKDVQGFGWKAATFNAKRLPFLGLLPTAPIAIPLMNLDIAYDNLWSIGQRAIGVQETVLDSDILRTPRTYTIDWLPDEAIFRVDDEVVLHAKEGITRNPLGFVAWLDNQFAVVTPKGQFKFGFVDVPEKQALILESVKIEPV